MARWKRVRTLCYRPSALALTILRRGHPFVARARAAAARPVEAREERRRRLRRERRGHLRGGLRPGLRGRPGRVGLRARRDAEEEKEERTREEEEDDQVAHARRRDQGEARQVARPCGAEAGQGGTQARAPGGKETAEKWRCQWVARTEAARSHDDHSHGTPETSRALEWRAEAEIGIVAVGEGATIAQVPQGLTRFGCRTRFDSSCVER